MRNYCGSVAADLSGDWFAVSSPRGNLVTVWSRDGAYHASVQVNDGCGVAPTAEPGTFPLSSGDGGLYHYRVAEAVLYGLPGASALDLQWDNHLRLIRPAGPTPEAIG